MSQPVLVIGEVGVSLGKVDRAALMPADILAEVFLDVFPVALRFDDRRYLSRIAALFADIAPVA